MGKLNSLLYREGDLEGLDITVPPSRVLFGSDKFCDILSGLDGLGIEHPIIVSTQGGRQRLKKLFPGLDLPYFDGVLPHGPEAVVEAFRNIYLSGGHDAVIAVGGGSVLGLGKIMSAEEQARFVAVPTTLSGSEMTPIYGRKIGLQKVTKVNPACQPDVIVYDPSLSAQLPHSVLSASAMNSLAHSVEAVFINKTQDTPELAQAAIHSLFEGVPAVLKCADCTSSRLKVQYGGFLGGLLIQKNGIALHHELCHVIGGLFGIDHGVSNSTVLAHVVAYNMVNADPVLRGFFFRMWGDESPADRVYHFAKSIDAPLALEDYGVTLGDVSGIVDKLLTKGFTNPPRRLDREAVKDMLAHIIEGRRPA